jgi:cytochrome b involved in lipid metabolism
MTLTASQTVHRVLRLRTLLPSGGVDGESFACGMCFPYACSCSGSDDGTDTTTTTTRSAFARTTSPKKSFLRPLNLAAHQSRGKHGLGAGRQTNIELAKEQHRAAESLHRQPSSASAATAPPCARCHAPAPSSAHTTRTSNASNACRSCHVYTAADLATHATKDDLWVSISGKAYDLTSFGSSHPGGLLPLVDVAGCDASDVFRVFHPAGVQAKLPVFQVGTMGEFDDDGVLIDGAWAETALQKDFHDMVRQLEVDGQFETDFGWYWSKVAVQVILFAIAVGLVLHGGNLAYFVSAVVLGMFWQQVAFLGHDLGHNSVRGTAAKDWFAGLLVTAFFGVSVQWWKRSHNVHHVVTNSLEHDPDIQHLPVFSVSEKAFKGVSRVRAY